MRVYLCVNRGLGLGMLTSFNKESKNIPIVNVYTQKRKHLKSISKKVENT